MKKFPVVFLESKKHRNEIQLLIRFTFNDQLISLTKTLVGAKWSKSFGCWYIKFTKQNLDKVINLFKNYTCINTSKLPKKIPFQRNLNNKQRKFLNSFYTYLQGKRYSISSVKTYTFFVADFISFHKNKNLNNLTNRDVELFIETVFIERNYSISSQRQFISAIKQFTTFFPETAIDNFSLERPKKSRKLPSVLSQEEVLEIIKCTQNLKHKAIISLIYSCGLRISELINLKLTDFNLDRKQVLVKNGKGRKDRYVNFAESFVPLLKSYYYAYKPKVYFVEGATGGKYSSESIRQFLRKSCKKANVNKTVTPHTLRHSYATHLLENGVDIRYIQTLLGHAKPETTMIYTHVKRSDLMKISNPLDTALKKQQTSDKPTQNLLLSGNI